MKVLREYIEGVLSIRIGVEDRGAEGGSGDDYFSGSKFSDGEMEWYVEDVLGHVESRGEEYLRRGFPVSELVHNLEWWQGDVDRALRADTGYPLLVLIEDGEYSVADGLNRLWKIVNVEKEDLTDVYLVPKEDIMYLGFVAK